jgi:hypothetical protein
LPRRASVAVQQVWDVTVDAIMIAADYLKRIAAWSRELNERYRGRPSRYRGEILSCQRIRFHAR